MSILKPLAGMAIVSILAAACATDSGTSTGMQSGDGGGGTGTTAGVGPSGSTQAKPGEGPPSR